MLKPYHFIIFIQNILIKCYENAQKSINFAVEINFSNHFTTKIKHA